MQAGPLIVLAVFASAWAGLWALALVDVFQRAEWDFPPLESPVPTRAFWMFVVVLFGGIGGLFYYVMVMRPRPRSRR